MQKTITILATAALVMLLASCKNSDNVKLATSVDSVSWALGENTALGLKQMGITYDEDMVLRAFKHTMKGKEQPMDDATYQRILANIALSMQENYMAKMKEQNANAAAQEAAAFKELTDKDPDIKKADAGYYYKVLKAGKGPNVKEGEVAVFDYKGFKLDGTPIDQTYGVRDPISHLVGGSMFEGLRLGLTQMNAGSIYRFYIPSALAFGAKGSENIPPYTALIYEVELHSFHE